MIRKRFYLHTNFYNEVDINQEKQIKKFMKEDFFLIAHLLRSHTGMVVVLII